MIAVFCYKTKKAIEKYMTRLSLKPKEIISGSFKTNTVEFHGWNSAGMFTRNESTQFLNPQEILPHAPDK